MAYEFENESEFVELDMDDPIDQVAAYFKFRKEQEAERGVVRVVNPKCLAKMQKAISNFRLMAKDNFDVKIKYRIDDLAYGGYVEVICPYDFQTANMPLFCETIALADNVEHVVAHGKIEINLGFVDAMIATLLDANM